MSNTTRRKKLKAEVRKEVMDLLELAGKGKTARKMREKFEKTGVLSRRDLKILRRTVERVAA
jgi:hypothetical protein